MSVGIFNQNEMKHCPFCGSDKLSAISNCNPCGENGLGMRVWQTRWYVRCNRCMARGPIASGKVIPSKNYFLFPMEREKFPAWQTTDDELHRKAIELWNGMKDGDTT